MFIGVGDPEHWLSNEGILVNSELYNMVMILFTIEFLNLQEQMPRLAKFLTWYRVFQIINIFLCQFVSYELGAKTASLSVIFTMTCISYAGIRSILRGYRPAYYYTLAFSLVLIGNVIVALKFRGYVPFNLFTEWVQIVGGATEAILLSLAWVIGSTTIAIRVKKRLPLSTNN